MDAREQTCTDSVCVYRYMAAEIPCGYANMEGYTSIEVVYEKAGENDKPETRHARCLEQDHYMALYPYAPPNARFYKVAPLSDSNSDSDSE